MCAQLSLSPGAAGRARALPQPVALGGWGARSEPEAQHSCSRHQHWAWAVESHCLSVALGSPGLGVCERADCRGWGPISVCWLRGQVGLVLGSNGRCVCHSGTEAAELVAESRGQRRPALPTACGLFRSRPQTEPPCPRPAALLACACVHTRAHTDRAQCWPAAWGLHRPIFWGVGVGSLTVRVCTD